MVAVLILAIVAAVGIIAATLLYFMKANTQKKYDEIAMTSARAKATDAN